MAVYDLLYNCQTDPASFPRMGTCRICPIKAFKNPFQGFGRNTRAVESVLELLGERLQVSRAYVFENSEDNLFYSNTFEWCAEGIEPQKDKMQNMAYSEFDSDYRDYFNERGILYCDDIGKFPRDIRELMESQGIQSMLQCAIKDNGVFKGWVGFDDCTSKCLWTINQIEVLSFISELLSLFLLKQRAQDNVMELAGDLRAVLDHQNSWIYVVDIGTPVSLTVKR